MCAMIIVSKYDEVKLWRLKENHDWKPRYQSVANAVTNGCHEQHTLISVPFVSRHIGTQTVNINM